jgi:hypothetical protein
VFDLFPLIADHVVIACLADTLKIVNGDLSGANIAQHYPENIDSALSLGVEWVPRTKFNPTFDAAIFRLSVAEQGLSLCSADALQRPAAFLVGFDAVLEQFAIDKALQASPSRWIVELRSGEHADSHISRMD